ATLPSFTDTTVSQNTTWFYRVRATNSVGDSANSNTASATTSASTLPAGWSDGDIGATGAAGSASYNNGAFTVQGAGADIYGKADAFHYAYQQWSGDGSIVVRVASMQNTDPAAKAGIMF